mmetsp:Transcript_128206/g.292963  ORF Transcript_128206/g.292963 Transcript_128206/m.292963 type:complete len:186 (+) Transcript_128206:28-585(+)
MKLALFYTLLAIFATASWVSVSAKHSVQKSHYADVAELESDSSSCFSGEEACVTNTECCSGRCNGSGYCKRHEGHPAEVSEELELEESDSSSCFSGEEACVTNTECCSGRCNGSGYCKRHEGHPAEVSDEDEDLISPIGNLRLNINPLTCLAQNEDCTTNGDCCSGRCNSSGYCKLHDGSHQERR